MLQRTQSLLIFLLAPGTSSNKSDIQRTHTWLTNQPINGEQRSVAKMTYSDIVTYHNQQYPRDLTQRARKARARALPAKLQVLQGDSGILQMPAIQAWKMLLVAAPSSLPSMRLALGKVLQFWKGLLGHGAAKPWNLVVTPLLWDSGFQVLLGRRPSLCHQQP